MDLDLIMNELEVDYIDYIHVLEEGLIDDGYIEDVLLLVLWLNILMVILRINYVDAIVDDEG